MSDQTTDPLTRQEGGGHYKDCKIQPVEYIHANGLGYCEGAVIKYVTRYKKKNGKEDLKKAIHFLELLIALEYPEAVEKKPVLNLIACACGFAGHLVSASNGGVPMDQCPKCGAFS